MSLTRVYYIAESTVEENEFVIKMGWISPETQPIALFTEDAEILDVRDVELYYSIHDASDTIMAKYKEDLPNHLHKNNVIYG